MHDIQIKSSYTFLSQLIFFNKKKHTFFILFFRFSTIGCGWQSPQAGSDDKAQHKCYLIIRTTNCSWLISDALTTLPIEHMSTPKLCICKPHLVSSIQWGSQWTQTYKKVHKFCEFNFHQKKSAKSVIWYDWTTHSLHQRR